MKKFNLILTLGLLLGLFFSTASAFAGAQPSTTRFDPKSTPGAQATERATGNPHGKRSVYRGVVASAGGGSLSLTLEDGSTLTFAITDQTKIKVPTLKGATLADLKSGMKVVVQAAQAEGGGLTALHVVATPGKPAKVHRVGTVAAYSAGSSITVQDKDGNTSTFALTADAKILPAERADQLAVGSRVTIIAPRNVTDGPLTAAGIVVHPAGG